MFFFFVEMKLKFNFIIIFRLKETTIEMAAKEI